MKAETLIANAMTNTITFHVSRKVLESPEALPNVLRNIVVHLAGRIPQTDFETFRDYMEVVLKLEQAFDCLND